MSIKVRSATIVDQAAIASLEANGAHHPWSPDQVSSTLALPTTRAWVALEGRRVVGHLITSTIMDEAEVLALTVAPDARRRGIGHRLLSAAEAAWSTGGVTTAHLEVHETNHPARALYIAHHWTPVGRRADYYGVGEDALLLRWVSTPA